MNSDAIAFEKVVTEIFHRHFFDGLMISTSEIRRDIIMTPKRNFVDLYLYTEKDKKLSSQIEIKYYRPGVVPLRILRNASYSFKINASRVDPQGESVSVMVVSCQLDRFSRFSLNEEFNHYYIDRDDLFFMAMPYPDLTQILVDFFADDFELDADGKSQKLNVAETHVLSMTKAVYEYEKIKIKSDGESKKSFELIGEQPEQYAIYERLKNDLLSIQPGRGGWREYEGVCKEILMFLFEEDLKGWHKQLRTDDELHRYDLVCRIKSNRSAWDFISTQLKSQYIVFEFKNYKEEIQQSQILTTEKYLFENALRKVAIIITRKGASEHALKMRDGAMRETGKMMLIIKDEDLIKMMEDTVNGEQGPSDYIYDLIDDMLLKLSR